MLLQVIQRDAWTIMAVCTDRGDCPFWVFDDNLPERFEGSMDTLFSTFEHIAIHGPIRTPGLSHNIDDGVFEFIFGQIRVPYFYGSERRSIIVTHGFLKKSKRINKREKGIAVNAKKRYFADFDKGEITILGLE